ncbi:MAG: arsenite methyltransferase [Candidatus Bathyarchaeota archaeon]
MEDVEIKKTVRKNYAEIAKKNSSCCGRTSCCGDAKNVGMVGKCIGYSDDEMKSIPGGANLGLGCGNPVALASLKKGETVLDLGSGAGMDVFLAANKVGEKGNVIGVDMTPEMIETARKNAKQGDYGNVEFRLGEIEDLPVEGNSVDVVISNCVINLSPDKKQVFSEIYRVLRPGGRVMVSDIVLTKELPDFIKKSTGAYVGCIAGAMLKPDYLITVDSVGFQEIEIVSETNIPVDVWFSGPTTKEFTKRWDMAPEKAKEIADSVVSIKLHAIKPIGKD